jgi:hypothetical protein
MANCVCGGLVCVLSSFLYSLEFRCAGSSDCGGVLEYKSVRSVRLGPCGPCMLTYIATLLGLAQINRDTISSTNAWECKQQFFFSVLLKSTCAFFRLHRCTSNSCNVNLSILAFDCLSNKLFHCFSGRWDTFRFHSGMFTVYRIWKWDFRSFICGFLE